ncbi:MAG: hypothetical protein ACOZAG_03625, partial [Patescibacteria group bacterium]
HQIERAEGGVTMDGKDEGKKVGTDMVRDSDGKQPSDPPPKEREEKDQWEHGLLVGHDGIYV